MNDYNKITALYSRLSVTQLPMLMVGKEATIN